MAKIDYWGIENEIAEILRANTNAVTVTVEEELMFGVENTPWIGIYLTDRTTPKSGQPIAAGRKTFYELKFTIWGFCHSLSLPEAMKLRSDFIGDIEDVLIRNRTINDKVETSWAEGGRLPSARLRQAFERSGDGGFIAGGEIALRAQVYHSW